MTWGLSDPVVKSTPTDGPTWGLADPIVGRPTPKAPGGGPIDSVMRGIRQTGRMVGAFGNTVTGDLKDVEGYAKDSRIAAATETPEAQSKLQETVAGIDRSQSSWQQIKDTVGAAAKNLTGTGQMVVEQLPNTAVALGSGVAGAVTGAKIGAVAAPFTGGLSVPAGTAIGFIGGMFLGNTALETGGKAIEKARDGFTEADRAEALREGAVKGGVITAVDAVTMGVGGAVAKTLGKAAIKAGAHAEAKVLVDAGVDMTSVATINKALGADAALHASAKAAGQAAANKALSGYRKGTIAGTGLALETVGEGAGEYLGELAATGKGDVVDATLESISSLSQSGIQAGYNYNKATGNRMAPRGILSAGAPLPTATAGDAEQQTHQSQQAPAQSDYIHAEDLLEDPLKATPAAVSSAKTVDEAILKSQAELNKPTAISDMVKASTVATLTIPDPLAILPTPTNTAMEGAFAKAQQGIINQETQNVNAQTISTPSQTPEISTPTVISNQDISAAQPLVESNAPTFPSEQDNVGVTSGQSGAELRPFSDRAAAGPSAKQLANNKKLAKVAKERKLVASADTMNQAIIKMGGISDTLRLDLTGDKKGNHRVPFVGSLFSKAGATDLSDLANQLERYGYFTQDEINDVDGGARLLAERLRQEFDGGSPWLSMEGTDDSAEAAIRQRQDEDKEAFDAAQAEAESRGFEFVGVATPENLEAEDTDKISANLVNTELLARAIAIDAQRVDELATQYEGFDDAFNEVIVAFLKEHENVGTVTYESGEADSAQVQGSPFSLESETQAQISAREKQVADEKKQADAAETKAAADAKKASDAKEIASRQISSAENFQLGQSAEESLSGQRDIFSQPAPPRGVTPQVISTARAENIIRIAADSIAKLRSSDVYRVITETPAPFKLSMASYIKDNRRDLADEVDSVMSESGKAESKPVDTQFANNKIFTQSAVDAARARLKKKLGNVNSGIDPELLQDGMVLAGAHIEAGARSFTAYSKAMIEDLGDAIKPYLRSLYESVRHYPGLNTDGMTGSADIDAIAAVQKEESKPVQTEYRYGLFNRPADIGTVPKGMLRVDPRPEEGVDDTENDHYQTARHGVVVYDRKLTDEETKQFELSPLLSGKDLDDAIAKTVFELSDYAPEYVRMAAQDREQFTTAAYNAMERSATAFKPSIGNFTEFENKVLAGLKAVKKTEKTNSGHKLIGKNRDGAEIREDSGGVRYFMSMGIKVQEAVELVPYRLADGSVRHGYRSDPENRKDEYKSAEELGIDKHGAKAQGNQQGVTENARNIQPETVPSGDPRGTQADGSSSNRDSKPLGAGLAEAGAGTDKGRGVPAGTQVPGGTGVIGIPESGESASGETRDSAGVRVESGASSDFVIDGESIGKGGLAKKYQGNVDAIRIIKAMESEGRVATPEERKQISEYVGWGAMKGVFDPDNKQWPKQYAELKSLLTDAEYSAARRSTLDAHYTSPEVVGAMYDAISRLGFTSGRLLEPSVGIGNFFGLMPKEMRNTSSLFGVELDPLTARLASALYPKAKITNTGFEDYEIPSEYFDAVIGNPPFGSQPLVDKDRSQYSGFSIHNYFLSKAIDKLRPGGIMQVVVSHNFLDAQDGRTRKWISERAALIGGVRLPNTAFKGNAGTEVVTDILIFQKNDPMGMRGSVLSWDGIVDQVNHNPKTGESVTHKVSQYFAKNPNNVLGTPTAAGTMYSGNEYTVEANGDLKEQLSAWVKNLPENIFTPISRRADVSTVDMAIPEGVKPGSFYVDASGKVMQRGTDVMGEKTALSWEPPNAKAVDRMRGMIGLRDSLRTQMRLERSLDAGATAIEYNRSRMNRQYDDFLRVFGHLNDQINRRIFFDDTESQLVQALEFDYDKGISARAAESEGVEQRLPKAIKADILNRRVAFPPQDFMTVTTGKDALLASLNYRGKVDAGYMTEVYGKPIDEIIKELGDVVFNDPQAGHVTADAYLSGDVKTKLDEAKAAAKDDANYKRNVAALEKVIPVDKKPSEITVSIGAAFVPAAIYQEFVKHISGGDATASYLAATGQWLINYPGNGDAALNTGKFGTSHLSAQALFQLSMQGRGAVVKKTIKNADGSTTTILMEKETEAAREKQNSIKAEWKSWLWSDPARADKVASIYNEKLNRIVKREYDGGHMTFPGMNPTLELLDHQKNGVWRGLQSFQVLYDHVVGAGKTFVMATLAMEMRRLGISRKPLFAVPNHLTVQWRSEFTRLYPGANILAAVPSDFSKENRDRMFSKIITGDWDAVVIGHSSLKKIGLPEATEKAVLQEQINEISSAIEATKRERGDRNIIRDMEGIKARLEAKMKDKLASLTKRSKVVTFDELGVDALFVDEMHEFKNLSYNSTMDRNPGMGNPTGSSKAFDMFVKTRWLFDTFGQKTPMISATGTPVSNSLVEMYNMQRYMQYSTLKQQGLHVFDAWAHQFGSVESVYEVSPSGSGYRQSTRFTKFSNLPGLMGMYNSFADTVTLDNLKAQEEAKGLKFPVPKITGGRPTLVVAKRSPQVAALMGIPKADVSEDGKIQFGVNLAEEVSITHDEKTGKYSVKVGDVHLGQAETEQDAKLKIVEKALSPKVSVHPESILGRFGRLRQLTKETKGKVNALSLTGEANKAALDYRLIDAHAADFPGSKINLAVDNMMRVYHQWSADRGAQLVFCDMSIPLSARKSYSVQERRLYVRDDVGAVDMKRGTMHVVEGHEDLPYFVVSRGEKDARRFDVYDSATGLMMARDSRTKQDARDGVTSLLSDDTKRQEWIDMREVGREISQEEMDEYNNDHNVETEDVLIFGREDIAGMSGSAKFSVYDDIKAKLVSKGVPENQVAFIHDFSSPVSKAKLFKAVNTGDVRILIGSTPKMGAGTNVQSRLVGLHHIDAPWRPSDLEQREGRIIRRGNLLYERDPDGFEVFIGRYATEQTYDTRRWQILEHKARGIEQLRNFDGTVNEMEDIAGEAANSADMKAAASGDPLILEETKLRTDITRLEHLQAGHSDEVLSISRKSVSAQKDAEIYGPRLAEEIKGLIEISGKHKLDKDGFSPITIDGKEFASKEKAQEELARAASVVRAGLKEAVAISYRGVEFEFSTPFPTLSIAESPTGEIGKWSGIEPFSPGGFVQRMANYINRLPAALEDTKASIEKDTKSATDLRELAKMPFSQAADLASAREAYAKVHRALMAKGADVPESQKVMVEAGIEQQKHDLREMGLGDALDEFLGAQAAAKIKFSQSTQPTTNPHTRSTLTAAIDQAFPKTKEFARLLLATGKFHIIEAKDIPVDFSQDGRVLAFVKDGNTYFVADNISQSNDNVRGLLNHELGVHALKLGRTDAEFQGILKQVDAMRKMGSKQVIDAFNRVPADTNPGHVTEEAAAYLVQNHPDLTISQKIIAYIRKAIRKLGASLKGMDKVKFFQWANTLTPEDIVSMATEATQNAPETLRQANREGLFKGDRQQQFYSQLHKVFRDAPDKIFGNGKQVAMWLQANSAKNQVKKDEIFWSGINDWLGTQGKVSKADVLAYLDGNGVQVQEAMLGKDAAEDALKSKFQKEGYDIHAGEDGMDYIDPEGDMVDYDELPKSLQKIVDEASKSFSDTKFQSYQLPGGENYKELLLTLPTESATNWDGSTRQVGKFQSSHYNQLNILAHVRFNERVDAEGAKVLFIEEIQSDWGQKGKKEGFGRRSVKEIEAEQSATNRQRSTLLDEAAALPDSKMAEFKKMNEQIKALGNRLAELQQEWDKAVESTPVPSAPFVQDTKAWTALALKRMLAYAVNNGFDRIAWTTGEQQAERYDLSKQIDHIIYENTGDRAYILALDNDEKAVLNETIPHAKLEDYVGKDIAKKIIEGGKEGRLKDADLKVGGEGMKGYYDQIVPNVANDILKKLGGGKVESVPLRIGDKLKDEDFGEADTRIEGARGEFGERGYKTSDERFFESYSDAVDHEKSIAGKNISEREQQGFTITPELRAKVMNEGLPMFSKASLPGIAATPPRALSLGTLGTGVDFSVLDPGIAKATVSRIGAVFSKKGWNISLRLAPTFDALPSEVKAAVAEYGKDTRPKGVVHDGVAYVIADEHSSEADLEATILHEVTGHVGIRRLYGNDINGKLGNLFLAIGGMKGLNKIAAARGLTLALREYANLLSTSAFSDEVRTRLMMEEVLSHIAEDPKFSDRVKSIIGAVRAWLRDHGFFKLAEHGEADLLHVLSQGKDALKTVKQSSGPAVLMVSGRQKSLPGTDTKQPEQYARQDNLDLKNGVTGSRASWDSPEPSNLDNILYKVQNKHIDLKRVIASIKESGAAIADKYNPYLQEELYHGRAAKRTQDFVNSELRPLLNGLALRGINIIELEQYLHARHAEEANNLIAERDPSMQDGGSGMKTQKATGYLAALPEGKRRKLEASAAQVDSIIVKTRNLYVSYGLVSKDQADSWAQMFQHYIPLMREDHDGAMGVGQGISVKGKEVNHRTGSYAEVVDILANIALQRERAIVRGEKNRVAVALAGLVKLNPNPDFWSFDKVPTERVLNEQTGLVEDRADPTFRSRDNVIIAKIKDGSGEIHERAVVFNESNERAVRMSEALKNLDAQQLEGLMGVSAKVTRYFAAINTQYNPIFGVVNLVRDFQGSLINLSSTPIAGHQKEVAMHITPALRGVYAATRAATKGNTTKSAWTDLWEEMQLEGGMTGYRDLYRNSEDRAKAIKHALDPYSWHDSKLGKIFTVNGVLKVPLEVAQDKAAWIFDWLSDYNQTMEGATRLSVYKAALDNGMNKAQAASLAKNISVNFNRKGQAGQQAGALYAFFNAAMQGSARIGETLTTMDKGNIKTLRLSSFGTKAIAGGVMLGSMQALALLAAGFDEDEPPEFIRERNLILPIGDKKYLAVPMPLGFHAIPNIGRVSTEFVMGGFKKPGDHALKLIGIFAEAFNPLGSSGVSVQTIAPTAIDPLVALSENKDWTGKPIARENFNKLSPSPGFTRNKDTASDPSKWLSEAINTLSGGTKYTPGSLSPTADQIDYLFGQVTGGVGRESSKLNQSLAALGSGEDLPPHKVPLLGRFYGNAGDQSSQGNKFYANLKHLNEIEAEIKGRRKEGLPVDEYKAKNPEYRLIVRANIAESLVSKLRTKKRELLANDASREQVKVVEDRMTALMSSLNQRAKEVREMTH